MKPALRPSTAACSRRSLDMGGRSVDQAESIESLRAELELWRSEAAAREEELRRARAHIRRLDAIINIFPGVIWEAWFEQSGVIRTSFINAKGIELLGYTEKEWLENNNLWIKMLYPEDRDRLLEPIMSGALKGASATHRLISKDGQIVWLEPHVEQISDPEELPVRKCGVALDVTDRVVAEQGRAASASRAEDLAQMLDALIASVPGAVWEMRGTSTGEDLRTVFISEAITPITGYSVEEHLRPPELWNEITLPEDNERIMLEMPHVLRRGSGSLQFRVRTKDGRRAWLETHARASLDPEGNYVRIRGVTMDISARKHAEEERTELREAVIRAQAQALEQLSTPLIPISEAILVMPLIGAVDARRAARVLEALLDGISKARARFAIIDITGVPSVDGATAEALLRAARGVRLLGAEVVLTGIRPEVAQTLVTLGQDLTREGIVTRGNLEGGIAYASRRS